MKRSTLALLALLSYATWRIWPRTIPVYRKMPATNMNAVFYVSDNPKKLLVYPEDTFCWPNMKVGLPVCSQVVYGSMWWTREHRCRVHGNGPLKGYDAEGYDSGSTDCLVIFPDVMHVYATSK